MSSNPSPPFRSMIILRNSRTTNAKRNAGHTPPLSPGVFEKYSKEPSRLSDSARRSLRPFSRWSSSPRGTHHARSGRSLPPSLIQLLAEGKIEYRKVRTHRRVRFEALMQYKRRADAERRAALDELAVYDQELGIWSWPGSLSSMTRTFCTPRSGGTF